MEQVNKEDHDRKVAEFGDKNNTKGKATHQKNVSLPGNAKNRSRNISQDYDVPVNGRSKSKALQKSASEKIGIQLGQNSKKRGHQRTPQSQQVGHQPTKSGNQSKHMRGTSRDQSVYSANPYGTSSTNLRFNATCSSKDFGDKVWKNQSAATLTHSVLSYSFSKGGRFNAQKNMGKTGSMYNLHSTLGKRSTSMGKGGRGFFNRKWAAESANKPAPTHYRINSEFDARNVGKTFGISYEAYENTTPTGFPEFCPMNEIRKLPGPGTYRPGNEIGADKLKYSLFKRGKMFNECIKWRSPGAIYNSNHDLVEQKRFNGCGFGFSEKYDFTAGSTKKYPGPGHYKLPTIFDKFFSR